MTLQSLEKDISKFNIKSTYISESSGRTTTVFVQPYVLKEFSSQKKHRNEWVTEHDVISTLTKAGIFVPRSYGYKIDESGASLYKEYIPGDLIQHYTTESLNELVKMFVEFHKQNVITRDAHEGNIIQTENNQLVFIDFGKSAIFKKKNLQFWLTLSREIFFIRNKVIKDNSLYPVFLNNYLAMQPYKVRWVLKSLFILACTVLQLRESLRHRQH